MLQYSIKIISKIFSINSKFPKNLLKMSINNFYEIFCEHSIPRIISINKKYNNNVE